MSRHAVDAMVTGRTSRAHLVKHGRKLEYFTIAYNSLEGLVAIVAGLFAGSIALVGFGFDSVIEVTSGGMLLWRLYADINESLRDRAERLSLRVVGVCFLALALYISYDSIALLLRQRAPERSIPGIVLALASLIVMPLLARAKRRVARDIGSAAMKADATQTEFCTWLSAILLGGLGAQCIHRMVVGRSGRGTCNGTYYCQGRSRGIAERSLLPSVSVPRSGPAWIRF